MADTAIKPKKYRFVLHEHYASHHHFDFRLEKFGTLKSWALPKGMPTKPSERRLAVQTPNHPLSYIDFKGVTPKGQYGAGTTYIKDHGTYETLKWSPNEISFILKGNIYKGKYALIKVDKIGKSDWIMVKGVNEK